MTQYEDRLKDYVDVKERIRLFYAAHPEGRLVTGEVTLTTEPDDVPRVMVQAFAYRTPDDGHPGVGHSWLVLPGTTPYTRGSEVENAETSAWGRAIASVGIGIDKSIASANEVASKEDQEVSPAVNRGEVETLTGRVSRRGIVRKGGHDDYKMIARQGPEGHVVGFRLEIDGDKNIPQCLVAGPLGESLWLATSMKPEALLGKPATVAGILYHVKNDKGSWYRLHVDFIETDEWVLPPQDPPSAEAPSEPLGLVG